MTKLHEIKTEVTFRPKIIIEDGAFDINICPVCGEEIGAVEVYHATKEGVFKDLHYRYAAIECPECGARFKKTVYDNYEKKTFLEVFSSLSVIIFVIALIGSIVSAILISFIPNIALIAEGVCLMLLGAVSISRLFID